MPKIRRHRRRGGFRRGFGGGSVIRNVTGGLKTAAIGAVAIIANNFIAGQLASMLNVDMRIRPFIKLGSALFALPLVAKFVPGFKGSGGALVTAAAAVALIDAVKGSGFLPAPILAQLAGLGAIDIDNRFLLPSVRKGMMPGNMAGLGWQRSMIPQNSVN